MALIDVVRKLCLARLGRLPDLEHPQGYNDIIQWLKLYDQTQLHIPACDKLGARQMAKARAGELVLIPVLSVAKLPTDLHLDRLPRPFMAKASHDSGSVTRVEYLAGIHPALKKLKKALSCPYGVEKGEWAYALSDPWCFAEMALPEPIVDYKFHCTHGQIRWVQVIRNRGKGTTRETILAPDGSLMKLWMDHKMIHDPDPGAYPGDAAWSALTELACKLAQDWRYVRVDLYWDAGRALFGELTFWPLSGCYKTGDEPRFGEMMQIDLSYAHVPLVS
jgi:hypothetical protein